VLLRSNVIDRSVKDLWRTYIQLTEVEAAFRIHKGDLDLRPVRHRPQRQIARRLPPCVSGGEKPSHFRRFETAPTASVRDPLAGMRY
jgi:hypothetical protein